VWLLSDILVVDAVDLAGFERDPDAGVDPPGSRRAEALTRRNLDHRDLDDSVVRRVCAGGLGVEEDQRTLEPGHEFREAWAEFLDGREGHA
jgi:hypothetical protein